MRIALKYQNLHFTYLEPIYIYFSSYHLNVRGPPSQTAATPVLPYTRWLTNANLSSKTIQGAADRGRTEGYSRALPDATR